MSVQKNLLLIFFEIPKNFGFPIITQYLEGRATKSETFGAFLGS